MATVSDLIRDAMRKVGILASEEAPTAAEQDDAFETLNDMVDSWANERLVLFATLRSTHTLTVSLNPHTIGTGGTFSTTRPVRIDRASIIPVGASGTEQPLNMLSDSEWQGLQGKTDTGIPTSLWPETSYPTAKLWLNPIPSAAHTLALYTWQQIGRFAATSTTFDMPPGYKRAVIFNLARELAPEYGVQVSPELGTIADEAKTAIRRLNPKTSYLASDPAVLGAGRFNIVTGGS